MRSHLPQSILLNGLLGIALVEIACFVIILFYVLYGLFAWEELPPPDEEYITNTEVFILLCLVTLAASYCLMPVFLAKKAIARGIPFWIVISVSSIELMAIPLIVVFHKEIPQVLLEMPYVLSTIMVIACLTTPKKSS